MLPKSPWLAERKIEAEWPIHGLLTHLHLDNAKEFRCEALRRGCEQYGIAIDYRPVRTPHYGGHIERLIGTVMGKVHILPGTTFSNIAEKGNTNPEKTAAMTIDELEQWLVQAIAGVYHRTIHRALGIAPVAAWERGLKGDGKTPGCGEPAPVSDPRRFLIDFLPVERRLIRRDGVPLALDPLLVGHLTNLDRRAAEDDCPIRSARPEPFVPVGARWPVLRPSLPKPTPSAHLALGTPSSTQAIANIWAGSRLQQRRLLNLLRWIGNELQISLIAVGTAEALHAVQSDDQLANRFEPVGLPPWRAGTEYEQLLSTLEAVLPLRLPSDLAEPDLANKILTSAEGILGEIVSIVTRAAVRAVASGSEVITASLIDQTGFIAPSQRRRVAV